MRNITRRRWERNPTKVSEWSQPQIRDIEFHFLIFEDVYHGPLLQWIAWMFVVTHVEW